MSERGVFITFEGGDGSGKSTQIAALARVLEFSGRDVCTLREPGGVRISEKIRGLLLDPELSEMDPVCELMLYEAARAQLVAERIEPALAAGKVVLCDRFTTSTLAYQGYGRGIDLGIIEKANVLACGSCIPDAVILLAVAPKEGLSRAVKDGADRLESAGADFHSRVSRGFMELASRDERIHVIHPGIHQETLLMILQALAPLDLGIDMDAVQTQLEKDNSLFFGVKR